MEKAINVITMDDGIDYMIVDEISINNTRYVYLSNVNDKEDFFVQKIKVENGQEILEALDSDEEFDNALKIFYEKHNNDLNV